MARLAAVVLILVVIACSAWYLLRAGEPAPTSSPEEAAGAVVTALGGQLQFVSLLASPADVARAMDEHYKPYLTRDLLTSWKSDPGQAQGRLTSSPWPDRIEVNGVTANENGSYTVSGSLIEVTSEDLKGGISNAYPIVATVWEQQGAMRVSALFRVAE